MSQTETRVTAGVSAKPAEDIKRMPPEPAVRAAVRETAAAVAAGMDRVSPPSRSDLEKHGQQVLDRLGLPRCFLGFAMVEVSNAFWREQFEAVPTRRRMLLLPHCLRDDGHCAGQYDAEGLHCAGCGRCVIAPLREAALGLGYEVVVAEGTSPVTTGVLEGDTGAILGVACLDSLEKSFARLADLGLPHFAVPLLTDGCRRTTVELDLVQAAMQARREAAAACTHSPLGLWRETQRTFQPESVRRLAAPCLAAEPDDEASPLAATEALALQWLDKGGKRLRPFVTMAAYAVARYGWRALTPGEDLGALLPDAVRRLALAIEALHKASLVHDDIEDDDACRYGEPTLHRAHGVPSALNVGDFLVGLGYRLIAGEAEALGAERVADILCHLSAAHLELCRGQGGELLLTSQGGQVTPGEALAIGARKTAPAFEVALYAGLRAAGADFDPEWLRRFAIYVGEGYQVLNDLDDWLSEQEKGRDGQDALAVRPTILRAFALEAGGGPRLAAIAARSGDAGERAEAVQSIYRELGAFEKAQQLLDRLRERALKLAEEARDPALAQLMRFLVRGLLAEKDWQRATER